MDKKEVDNKSHQVLNLGKLHQEVEKEKKNQKKRIIPITISIVGVILILFGLFFNNFMNLLNLIQKDSSTTENITSNENIINLKCRKSSTDDAIGLKTSTVTTYTFDNKLLKKVKVSKTITILDNTYETGSSNIRIYYQKYNDVTNQLQNISGLNVVTTLKNNILTNKVEYDLSLLDSSKIPQNNLISLTNSLNQEYKVIKEQEGKAGNVCKS